MSKGLENGVETYRSFYREFHKLLNDPEIGPKIKDLTRERDEALATLNHETLMGMQPIRNAYTSRRVVLIQALQALDAEETELLNTIKEQHNHRDISIHANFISKCERLVSSTNKETLTPVEIPETGRKSFVMKLTST